MKKGPTVEELILPRIIKHEYELGVLADLGSRYKGKLIGLDVADPYLDTPAQIKRAMVSALRRDEAAHYTRIRGLPDFVQSVSEFYSNNFGLRVDPMDEVMSTIGAGEALYIVFASIISNDSEFILPNPTFPNYASLVDLQGGVARFVPCSEDFHLNIDAIEEAVTKKTKAIVLCTPNNPTGAVYSKKELAAVLKLAEEHNLLIISDESYSQVTYDGRSHFSVGSLPNAMERTIVVNGLSKVYAMTGWRLGYILARKDLMAQFEKVAFDIRGSVNTAVQYAGAEALRMPQTEVAKIVKQYDQKRRLMVSLLREAGLSCHMPEGGFEAFPAVPKRFKGSMDLTRFLVEKAGVLVKPGVYFGPNGDRNIRVVYCKDAKTIEEALGRIAKALKGKA